jgi:hypothetical protein
MNIAGAQTGAPHPTDRQILFEQIQMHVIHAPVIRVIAIDRDEIGAVFMPCGFSVIPGVLPPTVHLNNQHCHTEIKGFIYLSRK